MTNATSNRSGIRTCFFVLAFSCVIRCSSSSRNHQDPSQPDAAGGTAGMDGSTGGGGGVEPDAALGGSAGASADAGPKFDAGACTGNPLVEYDFSICGGGCVSSGLCTTASGCGTGNVCSFDGYDPSTPVEYLLPFEGVCSGKLVFTAAGSGGAKIRFFGIDSDTGNEVVLATLSSQPCITPGLLSFALPIPATQVILTVPPLTTAYLDDVLCSQ